MVKNQKEPQQNPKSKKGSKSGKSHKYEAEIIPIEKDLKVLRSKVEQLLKDATYIVFDIETTGGNPEKNGITEICAIKYKNGEVLDKFYSMVNPKVAIPPIVRRMTGINNKMVRKAPVIREVMPGLLDFVGEDILVSHNTIGDLKFLRYFAMKACGHDLRNFFLCTHLLTEKLIPESKDKSLQGLAKFLELGLGEAHRAEADSYLTRDLFAELLVRLEKAGISHIIDAIRFQGDLESGIRLGWGIEKKNTKNIPSESGVLRFYNREGSKLFFTSAYNCSREFNSLQQLSALPKQLLRTLLKAYRLEFETHPHIYMSMLAEAKYHAEHKVRVEAYNWHMRTIYAICFIQLEDGKVHVKVGSIHEKTLYAFGPIVDKKEANQLLGAIADVFSVTSSRQGFEIEEHKLDLLKSLFDGSINTELKKAMNSLLSLKSIFNSNWRKTNWHNFIYSKKLAPIKQIGGIKNLLEENGVMVIGNNQGTEFYLFPIVGSLPLEPIRLAEDWEAWLYKSEPGRKFLENLHDKVSQSQFKPLSREEAYLCKATLWILCLKKGKLTNNSFFISSQELLSKS
ncbi:MAG: hypothetical protein HRU09_03280 [Oligoflexales bacterium]|nr:hypothetical protein [Oligoflexales bacterium]